MAKKNDAEGGGKKKGGVDIGTIDPGAPSPSQAYYKDKVASQLADRFQYKSPMQIPKLLKIVVNMGVGDAVANSKLLDSAVDELALITGQKPSIRRAKKSIATFKLREGQPIGAKVTLRGARMWEFFDRLTMVAIPRIRDFRGLPSRSFDGRGNYTFGLKEQVVFPEIDYDKVEKVRGMDITLVTSAPTDEEGLELLKALNWPFRK
ncbi:MAG: 50S ribosomal protein L5 [Candidatus Eisenbacteria bacterium]|uniref:Large ribosomal subunit protein uL5 n=1 Tax=Eiseniibacteriota bacterium TaxID=2212470 RepID=A0A956NI43_UNCEI|nr:50S ribosomal protein L5 [Candidatus Eisenbacteria bacterium]MCB9463617.1 50S ribosomal protein L5 [Candidatus Eisenbacteria bacterium]